MSGFSFSTPTTTTAATGFSFGQTQPTAAPSFGTGLGLATTATTSAPSLNFSFGTPAATTTQSSFGLGATPSFGLTATTPATTAAAPAAALPTFGTSTPTLPAFGGTTGLSFGTTTAATTAPTLSLSTPTSTVATSAAPPAFGATLFGAAKTTATAAPLTFGATTAAAPTLGLFGKTTAPTTLTTAVADTVAAPEKPVGLGGVDVNAVQPKTVEGKTEGGKVRESQVPNEIIQTVDALKAHIKLQKTLSSDIARNPTRKLFNVSTDIDTLNWKLQELGNNLDTNKSSIKLLRYDTANTIQHADMAQRTHDTPAGLQFENVTPLKYFVELIQKYEHDMIQFKHQVESTEKHMLSLTSQQTFTSQDLKKGLQQMHESFVALAGRLHELHQKVDQQKEQYLNFQKFSRNNTTNPFETGADEAAVGQYKTVSSGPTPFSAVGLNLGIKNNLSQAVTNPWGNISTNTAVGGTFGGAAGVTNASAFNFSSGSTEGGAFALQKPPIGSKRNKH